MNRLLLIACLIFCQALSVLAQTKIPELPTGAVVLETRRLNSTTQPNRMLVLWMLNPTKNPSGYNGDDIYSCPDQSRGSYYSGPTRVSLVDSVSNKIINTLNVEGDDDPSNLDLPYAILKGYYYEVPSRASAKVEAKPTIMVLKDYNGDGRAMEFALFDAVACMGLGTSLIGYSEQQDKVIQYPVELTVSENGKRSTTTNLWADYLFNKKPVKPGVWKYEIDYRGRGGTLDQWKVNYNATKEIFEATLTVVNDEP